MINYREPLWFTLLKNKKWSNVSLSTLLHFLYFVVLEVPSAYFLTTFLTVLTCALDKRTK